MEDFSNKQLKNIIDVFTSNEFINSNYVRLIFNENTEMYIIETEDYGTKLTHHRLIDFGNKPKNYESIKNFLIKEISNKIKPYIFNLLLQQIENKFLEKEFTKDCYPNFPITFEQAFMLIRSGKKLDIYCGNNKYPEKMGFFYEKVNSIKKLCKLFSKLYKKFSYIEIKIHEEKLSKTSLDFIDYLKENEIDISENIELSIQLVHYEMITKTKLNQQEILSDLFKETFYGKK